MITDWQSQCLDEDTINYTGRKVTFMAVCGSEDTAQDVIEIVDILNYF